MERKKIITQGSLREFENDGDPLDRYYLPARGLIIQGEHHILPDDQRLMSYYKQLNEILEQFGLNKRNGIFIPDSDYLLDLAILQNLTLLKDHINSSHNYRVYPYAITEETLSWINELKRMGFNIDAAFPKKRYFDDLYHPSHRGGWGRWVTSPNTPSFPEINNLPYPTSWIGQGLNQIIEAYERVISETGNNCVFFKPIFSAGGFTLAKISSIEELENHYEKLKSQGSLQFDNQEIPVEIQAFVSNIEELYSFQYTENGRLITPMGISKQIIKDNQWQGNSFNERRLDEELKKIWEKFTLGYKNYEENFGWGGIDLAKTPEGWIILEHNGLRITGAHPAISLAYQLKTINKPFSTLKSPGEVNSDLETLWNFLSVNNLAFNPNIKTGVFPIVWFPGSGMLWAAGKNPLELLEKTYNDLAKENYII